MPSILHDVIRAINPSCDCNIVYETDENHYIHVHNPAQVFDIQYISNIFTI